MRRSRYVFWTALIMLTIGAPHGGAQQQSQQPAPQQAPQPSQNQGAQPIPAYRSPMSGTDNGSADDANGDPQALAPDTRSLAGAEDLSLGAPKIGHRSWAPYLNLSSTLASNPLSSNGGTGWTTWTSFSGGVDLQRISGNSDLALTYLGGDAVSNSGGRNSILQQLGVSERLAFRRYAVNFLDQALYTPESTFGYAGVGGAYLSTGGNLGLQAGFTPNQSIVTALGQRISNTSIVEVNAFLTPRSSLTFVGSYGLLHYFDTDLNNNKEASVQAGYNYLLTRKDTIALLYRFDTFRFDHIAQSINDNSVLVSYARRLTGRLAFQISGGPSIAFSQTPIPGSLGSSGGTGGTSTATTKTQQLFWHLNSDLRYQLRRTPIQLSYFHGVSGGSGVLAGAITDNVSFTGSRQLTPALSGSLIVGYSRNHGLAITPATGSLTSNQVYDYWYTNVNFNRALLRSMILSLGYQVNYQNSNSSFCVTANCGTSYLQHQVFLSLGWHPRPTAF